MIEVNNLTKVKIKASFLITLAKKVLKGENRVKEDLSIALVSAERIKDLNKNYRGINKPTDVLSFRGDIWEVIICPSEVKKNIDKFSANSTFQIELDRVLVHGILHILGYDHEGSKKEALLMNNKENKYLS